MYLLNYFVQSHAAAEQSGQVQVRACSQCAHIMGGGEDVLKGTHFSEALKGSYIIPLSWPRRSA